MEDKIDWIRIPEAYHLITTDKQYDCVMPFGVKAFTDKMEQYVPGSRPSVTAFFELSNEVRVLRPIPAPSTATPIRPT